MRVIEDALERQLTVPETPRRIVSLVPSVTELLFDLGVGARVVGVTRFCTEPEEALARVARVGGTKDPDCRVIGALEPDLVIAVKEENLRRHVRELEAAGIAVYVADVHTVEDAMGLIGEIGDLVDAEASISDALVEEVRAGVDAARSLAPISPARVFCAVWRDPWLGVSSATYMGDVLRICGARPVPPSRHGQRYPKTTLEEVRQAEPQAILLPSEPYPFGERDAAELAGIAPVHLVDGKLLGWYGRRTGELSRVASLLAASN